MVVRRSRARAVPTMTRDMTNPPAPTIIKITPTAEMLIPLTDTLTAYKLYPAQVMRNMKLRTSGFETDHEITAKLNRVFDPGRIGRFVEKKRGGNAGAFTRLPP